MLYNVCHCRFGSLIGEVAMVEECYYCGHENPEGFKFCNECGRKKYIPPPPVLSRQDWSNMRSLHFPIDLHIHPKADIAGVIHKIAPEIELLPEVEEFDQIAREVLYPTRYQVFVRRHKLHLPGPQDELTTFVEIGKEREGSAAAANYANRQAERLIHLALLRREQEMKEPN